MYEVIIIGGGLLGMLSARELARAGCRVALFDRGQTGRESTWAGGGILSPLYPWRFDDAVNALARWGQPRYAAFAGQLKQESGIDPEYEPSGLLILDCDEREAALTWARRWEADVQLVGAGAIRELEPRLGSVPAEALWLPEVGQLRNPRLARAARGSLDALGVAVYEQQPVEELLIEAGRCRGVVSSGGTTFHAEQVVIAGGAWSAGLLETLGIALPVRPVRGQMILYRGEPGALRRIVLSQDRYIIPRRDGRVLVGSTIEEVGFDKSTTDEALATLREAGEQLVPALAEWPLEHQWAGLRPGSPHGIPYIGEVPGVAGLYLNTGHFRNGVVLGLASARLLSDLMLGREPTVPPAPYQPAAGGPRDE
ncbi:glycine oxidase ThiO [Thiohalophilus sp.]|uniref:glycine oxidase ThiO n=1 Tax=Thiohalophilus sp. TaxID=3028392 RepID=UPI002ACE608E|nr:glycine oxidase ThiO [Thiohalophilus sp.]MDZ7663688.1 glycine oxidase ThiO [Thiohalophilus sp.]